LCMVCLTLQCHSSEAGAPPDSGDILLDDSDFAEIAIDELMPNGGNDEVTDDDDEEEEAETGEREDSDSISSLGSDTRYAPSDESFEHFSKMAPHEYRMEDVEEYERKYLKGKDLRWPKATVPYEFSFGIQRRPKGHIKSAMKEWMDKTCIQFKPWTPSLARELGHNDRVTIENNARGCFSKVGKVGSLWARNLIRQNLNLEPDTFCESHRTVLHELGHTLGYWHEQQRPDRDNYITVLMQNVQPGIEGNFIKPRYPGYLNDFTPYDFLSIMHYGYRAGGRIDYRTRSSLPTMIPRNKCYKKVMGKPKHLSYNDHKVMNMWYGCTKGCDASQCGKDCYSTRSGENGQCHCVCNEDNDPCKGSTGNNGGYVNRGNGNRGNGNRGNGNRGNGNKGNGNGGPKNPCTDKSYYCKNLSSFSCQYSKTFQSICCATCQKYKHSG